MTGTAGHVHDWQALKTEEVQNPASGPSAYGRQTVALLRCGKCGDVGSRVLAGQWTLEDLQRARTGSASGPVTPGSGSEEESND